MAKYQLITGQIIDVPDYPTYPTIVANSAIQAPYSPVATATPPVKAAPAAAPTQTYTPPAPQTQPQPRTQTQQQPQPQTQQPAPQQGVSGAGAGLPDSSFLSLLNGVNSGLQQNNQLVDQKNAVVQAMLGNEVDREKLKALPPDIQSIIKSGNRDQLMLQAKIIDDALQGRNTAVASSIQYLTAGYKAAQEREDKLRQDAISNIENFVTAYGDQAGPTLRALYGQGYIDQLKEMGLDIDAFAAMASPTVNQTRYESQYGTPGSGLDITMPSGTIASRTNNPLNLKYSATTASYGATDSGIAGQDGGTFSAFNSPQEGLQAAIQLLESSVYNTLTVDQAMKKWSNSGYGAEVSSSFDKNQKMSSLSQDQLEQLVTDMAKRESGATIAVSPTMVQSIAQGIASGNQPPSLTGLYGKSGAVRAELQKMGYDLTRASQDWEAIKRWQSTVNGPTYQRAIIAADSAFAYITNLRRLSEAWNRGGNPILNKVNLEAANQGAFGSEAQATAQQFKTQIADLEADMASVYRYGLSSTDSSMQNAAKTLSENWSDSQLQASLDVIEDNLHVRINSLRNPGNALSSAGGTNSYVGGSTQDGSYEAYLKAIGAN